MAGAATEGLQRLAGIWQTSRQITFSVARNIVQHPGIRLEGPSSQSRSLQLSTRQAISQNAMRQEAFFFEQNVAKAGTLKNSSTGIPINGTLITRLGLGETSRVAEAAPPFQLSLKLLRTSGSSLLKKAGQGFTLKQVTSQQGCLRQFHMIRSTEQQALPFAASQLSKLSHTAVKQALTATAQAVGQRTGRHFSASSWADRVQQQLKQGVDWVRGRPKPLPKLTKATVTPVAAQKAATVVRPVSTRAALEEFAKHPRATIGRLAGTYREAAALQVEAFWRRNYPILLGIAALLLVMLLWRLMYGVASTFISFSEGMAKYGFLALSASMVAFAGLYLRSRYTISPDSIYRKTMRMLQVDAQVLEVLGAPLSGSEVRAYVMSGGGLRVKNWSLGLSSRRCFMIFPIRGSERRGIVSADIKKKHGKHVFKLVAVDVPTATEEQRVYVLGDEAAYIESGGVIAELRDPVVRALAKQKDFEEEDEREEAEEARLEAEEYERKAREREEKAEMKAAAEREQKILAAKASS